MITLEEAIILATEAHKGQTDLCGEPYILHSLFVMSKMDIIIEKIVAVLHDVTEDTDYTLDDLSKYKLTENVVIALWLLDKNNHKDYETMIKHIERNSIAKKVKIADLEHNMDLRRIINGNDMSEKDMKRIKKYMWSWNYLKNENSIG